MSDDKHSHWHGFGVPSLGIAIGIFWYVWGVYGFWWGLLYGLFWPSWLAYRLAAYLLGHV